MRPAMPPMRPAVSLPALWCPVRPGVPCAPCGALCALKCPCAPCDVLRALGCPVRSVVPCAPWGVPVRSVVPCAPCGVLCALGCPVRSGVPRALWGAPMRSGVPLARSGGAPCPLWGCPLPALGVSCVLFSVLCTPLQCPARLRQPCGASRPAIQSAHLPRPAAALCPAPWRPSAPPRRTAEKKPGRSKRSGRALFISLSGDEAQVSDQALGLPNWQSLLPESEVHISSMFRGSL